MGKISIGNFEMRFGEDRDTGHVVFKSRWFRKRENTGEKPSQARTPRQMIDVTPPQHYRPGKEDLAAVDRDQMPGTAKQIKKYLATCSDEELRAIRWESVKQNYNQPQVGIPVCIAMFLLGLSIVLPVIVVVLAFIIRGTDLAWGTLLFGELAGVFLRGFLVAASIYVIVREIAIRCIRVSTAPSDFAKIWDKLYPDD